MITLVAFATAIVCLGTAVALALLLRKVSFSSGSLPVTSQWIEELSIERYRPMLRLLDNHDSESERSHPGFTKAMAFKIRSERCLIFRNYLECLTADFNRVRSALKIIMLQSGRDRPDLAAAIVQQQMLFSYGLVTVHSRLFLYRWGICTVDAAGLMKIFDAMRLELQSMVPMAEPLCA